jgi:2-oxoglutarate dehydrogenase E2 component (dihydrolipoamide succinyltransferase)
MSIENSLKRIADALESINKVIEANRNFALPDDLKASSTTTAAPAAPVAPAAAAAPAAPAAPAPAAAAAAAPVLLTDAEMNTELVNEFKRIGDRTLIDAEMTGLGVTGVTGLTAEVQQELLTKVRAIVAPAKS